MPKMPSWVEKALSFISLLQWQGIEAFQIFFFFFNFFAFTFPLPFPSRMRYRLSTNSCHDFLVFCHFLHFLHVTPPPPTFSPPILFCFQVFSSNLWVPVKGISSFLILLLPGLLNVLSLKISKQYYYQISSFHFVAGTWTMVLGERRQCWN